MGWPMPTPFVLSPLALQKLCIVHEIIPVGDPEQS
jgi:hypothetical protein